ncbi:MAG: OB-fold nucleic acid binding domain-containing protein [Candidatus Bathyarchaeia archaeon]
MKIRELRDGMKQVYVEGKVIEKSETREVIARFSDTVHRVATAIIADETGRVKLTLWNDQIGQVEVNDLVKVEKGYVSSFRGEIQLNIGKYGKLTVEKPAEHL